MRWLFLGDVVGSPGVRLVLRSVPKLRQEWKLDLVVINAENANGGSGMNPSTYRKFREAGVDLITMGDHIYKRMELAEILEKTGRVAKPANFPARAPGPDHVIAELTTGKKVAVISLLGRTFMRPVDCPFSAVDRVLAELPQDLAGILVDIHAEATADKYLMLHHLQGRVTAVLGTHTHVATADEHILNGTAFQCDVGMTGPYDGILGRRVDRVLPTTITFVPSSFEVSDGDARISGAVIEVDSMGKATLIQRIQLREEELKQRSLWIE
jgi:2',3'-cyclic-nucleotide 2'-phosphodiesterase